MSVSVAQIDAWLDAKQVAFGWKVRVDAHDGWRLIAPVATEVH